MKKLKRWVVLVNLTLPFLTMPLMNCGNNDNQPDVGDACTTDEDCVSGLFCENGVCTEGCEVVSCEVDSDCVPFQLTKCVDGCCE